jgi:hypothetical protein
VKWHRKEHLAKSNLTQISFFFFPIDGEQSDIRFFSFLFHLMKKQVSPSPIACSQMVLDTTTNTKTNSSKKHGAAPTVRK